MPKTGGSTITEILAPYVNPKGSVEERRGWQSKFHQGTMHSDLYLNYAGFFKFAFVRNPYDRALSWYRSTAPGRTLPCAHTQVRGLDYLARFENYEEEVQFICDKLEIELKEIPHRGDSSSKFKPLSQAMARQIYTRYRPDFDAFGYEKESWRKWSSPKTSQS
ncbi:sulfotransferase family protein [bacterium]|nr:sulfotransferase family protein [bacterium]